MPADTLPSTPVAPDPAALNPDPGNTTTVRVLFGSEAFRQKAAATRARNQGKRQGIRVLRGAIRSKCLECTGNSLPDIAQCTAGEGSPAPCSLWFCRPYRQKQP
jgi:hypothetical protein